VDRARRRRRGLDPGRLFLEENGGKLERAGNLAAVPLCLAPPLFRLQTKVTRIVNLISPTAAPAARSARRA
jgi:P pilus assembly chaperone PapD